MTTETVVYEFEKGDGRKVLFNPAAMEKITLPVYEKYPPVIEKITATEKMLLTLLGIQFPAKA